MYAFTPTSITIPASELDALLPFASKDRARTSLATVAVLCGAMYCTDGHSAIHIERCDPAGMVPSAVSGVWPLAYVTTQIDIARAGLKGTAKRTAVVTLAFDGFARDMKPAAFEAVFKVTESPQTTDKGFNAHYMARIAKVSEALDPGSVYSTMVMHPSGALDPVCVSITGPEQTATILVMPVRLDDKRKAA